MGIPAGYEKLAAIGIAYKGDYTPGNTYKLLHAVYYSGSTYVALKDDPVGPPVDDKVNWQYMAKGFIEGVMAAINVTDTSGVLGSAGDAVNAQTFIDALADKVMTKLIYQNKIVTDLLATATDTVLSGALGPTIDQRLTELMDKVTLLNGDSEFKRIAGLDFLIAGTDYSGHLEIAASSKIITVRFGVGYTASGIAKCPLVENRRAVSVINGNVFNLDKMTPDTYFLGDMMALNANKTIFQTPSVWLSFDGVKTYILIATSSLAANITYIGTMVFTPVLPKLTI